jgi:hypothetical protein
VELLDLDEVKKVMNAVSFFFPAVACATAMILWFQAM